MTAPTRRQMMVAALAAGGSAAMPTGAVAADPEERLRQAVLEMEAAVRARWPERGDVRVFDDTSPDDADITPVFMIACHPTRRARP